VLIIVVTRAGVAVGNLLVFLGTGANLCVQDIATYAVCPQLKPIIASGWLMTIAD